MRILSKKEIERLTGKVRRDRQAASLDLMSIKYRINAIGDIIVIDIDVPISSTNRSEDTLSVDG